MLTLKQILKFKNLMGTMEAIKSGLPDANLPGGFTRGSRKITGNTGSYLKVNGNRKTARIVQYGSPSVARSQEGVTEVPVTLMHSFEHIYHDVHTLNNIRNTNNPDAQKMGAEEIGRQIARFKSMFTNLRIACIYSALSLGKIHFDGDGNLLPSSSGAVTTIDFGVPAGNQSQLDVFGDGALVGTKWSNSAAPIPSDVKNIKKAAKKKTGYPLQYAFYGDDLLANMLANTAVQKLIGTGSRQAAFAAGEIPNPFLGLTWIPFDEAFFVDDSGSLQEFCAADQVTFTPAPTPDWYELIEGGYTVPTNIGNVSTDALAALRTLREVFGMFNYAVLESDPVSLKHLGGDTQLPVIKVPGSVFILDSDF